MKLRTTKIERARLVGDRVGAVSVSSALLAADINDLLDALAAEKRAHAETSRLRNYVFKVPAAVNPEVDRLRAEADALEKLR